MCRSFRELETTIAEEEVEEEINLIHSNAEAADSMLRITTTIVTMTQHTATTTMGCTCGRIAQPLQ
jgi:hypothetical protein